MPCPICRCPVMRDPAFFASDGIAHQSCVDRHEGLRANEVRKRRHPRVPQPIRLDPSDARTARPARGGARGPNGRFPKYILHLAK